MLRFLAPLRDAYAAGDLDQLVAVYGRARCRPDLALPLRLLEAVYPVWGFLQTAPELNRRIAEQGLAPASRWLLDAYAGPWRCEMPDATRHALTSGPVLVYGNHLSLLTPFLVAAAVDRADLRIVSASYVHRLLPSYEPFSLPVATPHGSWREELQRGGVRSAIQSKILGLMSGTEITQRTREKNRESLLAGAAHLREGGCLLVCPEGGSIRHRPWHAGIGHIVHGVAGQTQNQPVQGVPYLEQHMSHRRACVSVGRGPWARLRRRFAYRHPVTIRFADPITLQDLTPADDAPEKITLRLQAHYRRLFNR